MIDILIVFPQDFKIKFYIDHDNCLMRWFAQTNADKDIAK